jgi:hypothetical protein
MAREPSIRERRRVAHVDREGGEEEEEEEEVLLTACNK